MIPIPTTTSFAAQALDRRCGTGWYARPRRRREERLTTASSFA